jgi:hypothetical protein
VYRMDDSQTAASEKHSGSYNRISLQETRRLQEGSPARRTCALAAPIAKLRPFGTSLSLSLSRSSTLLLLGPPECKHILAWNIIPLTNLCTCRKAVAPAPLPRP